MSTRFTVSTELIDNFKHVDTLDAQGRFQALQTRDGHALLFAIGEDGVLRLIEQVSGAASAWQVLDLSGPLARAQQLPGTQARCFAVSQNMRSGRISIALVLAAEGGDRLFVALDNEPAGGALDAGTLRWTALAYDDPEHAGAALRVEAVMLAASCGDEHLVVDIAKSSFGGPAHLLKRYAVATSAQNGPAWRPLPIGGDLEPGAIACLGRREGDRVDGLYTLGQLHGTTEILYSPLFNAWNPDAAPSVTRLSVHQGADAMALADNGRGATDLFYVRDQALYLAPAGRQHEGQAATLLLQDGCLEGVSQLHALRSGARVVVWGLNRADQVFYTASAAPLFELPEAWSHPMVILDEVEQISPYLQVADSASVFFALRRGELVKLVQSPATTMWEEQRLEVPASADTPPRHFVSYTTHVHVSDAQGAALRRTPVSVSSSSRVSVRVNHLHYLLTPTPIGIATDDAGNLTFIQEADGLCGAQLRLQAADGSHVDVNPMAGPLQRLTAMDTPDALRQAQVKRHDGSTEPLFGADAGVDLQQLAHVNQQLGEATRAQEGGPLPSSPPLRMVTLAATGPAQHPAMARHGILVALGDLVRWIRRGVSYVAHFVKEAGEKAWHAIVTIGQKVYRCVLDCAEKVAAAVKVMYEAVKVAIHKVVDFLKFVFSWKDIARTKKVMKQMVVLYVKHEIAQLPKARAQVRDGMRRAIAQIDRWGGLPDAAALQHAQAAVAGHGSAGGDEHFHSAAGNQLAYHLQGHAAHAQPDPGPAAGDTAALQALSRLQRLLDSEGAHLGLMVKRLQTLLGQDLFRRDFVGFMKEFLAILAELAVETADTVVDAAFDALTALLDGILDFLDTPVYIPIVSEILGLYGVKLPSVVDVLCWVVAVPYTVVYKLVEQVAPFPDDAFTQAILDAGDFAALQTLFAGVAPVAAPAPQPTMAFLLAPVTAAAPAAPAMPHGSRKRAYQAFHSLAGIYSTITMMMLLEDGDMHKVSKFMSNTFKFLAGQFLPQDRIAHQGVRTEQAVFAGVNLVTVLGFGGTGLWLKHKVKQAREKGADAQAGSTEGTARKTAMAGALLECLWIVPLTVGTVQHFVELSRQGASKARSAAIIDETCSVLAYLRTVAGAVKTCVDSEDVKLACLAASAWTCSVIAVLQFAEAGLGSSFPD